MRLLAILLGSLVLVAASCGGSDGQGAEKQLTIGSKNFPEAVVLGELYSQALRAKGYDVTLRSSIGSTELIDKSLTSGRIDMYPEYTGTMLTVVFGEKSTPAGADETYEQAKTRQAERGFTLLERTPFSDTDAIAVPKQLAEEKGLSQIGDLTKLGAFKLGGFPEFETRLQALPGLKRNYGIDDVQFVPLAGLSAYQALDQGTIDVAAVFSTDPQLLSGDYTMLEDPKASFGFQNVAPVVKTEVADRLGGDFADTVNAVSATLTDDAVRAMNKAVVLDKRPAGQVAKEVLTANDLI